MATHSYRRTSDGLTIAKGTSHTFTIPAFSVPAGERFVRFKVCKGVAVSSMELQQIATGVARPSWDTWLTDTAVIAWTGSTAKVKVKNNRTNNQSFRVYIDYETEDLPTYSVTCKVTGSGTLTANKASAYQGQQVTLTPKPASGYKLSKYTSSPSVTISNNKFTMPGSAVTITAQFTNQSYALTVKSSDSNMGSVSGSGTYPYNSSVAITATPKSGYEFTGWTTTAGTIADPSAESTTITIPAGAATVTAHFAKKQDTRTVVGYYHNGERNDCNVAYFDGEAFIDCDVYIYTNGQWEKGGSE